MPPKKKYLKEAAARARAAASEKRRASRKPSFASIENPTEPSPAPSAQPPPPSPEPLQLPSPILVGFDSESECGYQGGVNHNISDDDGDNLHGDGSEGTDAGYETLSEFDDSDVEEMERRGAAIQESLYLQIQLHKSVKEWRRTEANHALGYNGHSSRTIRQQAMEARKRQEMRDTAKMS